MIPSVHYTIEDLGQQARIQLQTASDRTFRNGVEHTNGSKGQRNVHLSQVELTGLCQTVCQNIMKTPPEHNSSKARNHLMRVRSHGLEVAVGHGDVTSTEMAVALVPDSWLTGLLFPQWTTQGIRQKKTCCCRAKQPAVTVTHELLLASSTANCTIGEEQRHTSALLHEFHGLCEPEVHRCSPLYISCSHVLLCAATRLRQTPKISKKLWLYNFGSQLNLKSSPRDVCDTIVLMLIL